jgi:hypothetical protein
MTPRRAVSPTPGTLNAELIDGTRQGSGAVLKIAHLGDCMGMLVRGEDIVWRSEEMWWSVSPFPSPLLSTSLTLSSSSTPPSNLAPSRLPSHPRMHVHSPSPSSRTISSFSPPTG